MCIFFSNSNNGLRSGKLFNSIDTPCWSPLINLHLLNGLMYNEVGNLNSPLLITSNLTLNYDKSTREVEFVEFTKKKNNNKIILRDDVDNIYIAIKCSDELLQLLINDFDIGDSNIDSHQVDQVVEQINGNHIDGNFGNFRWISRRDRYSLEEFRRFLASNNYIRYVKRKRDFYTIFKEKMDKIDGFEYNIAKDASQEYINTLLGVIPSDGFKSVYLEDGSYKNVLFMVSCGFDVIISDYPSRLSEDGKALLPHTYYKDGCEVDIIESDEYSKENSSLDKFVIDLKEERYKTDYMSKIALHSPREESRGYIHHLLRCNEPLAMVLLQINNNYVYDQFFHALRESVRQHNFEEFRTDFI